MPLPRPLGSSLNTVQDTGCSQEVVFTHGGNDTVDGNTDWIVL